MTDKEIAAELKKETPALMKVIDWVRRHIYVAFGRHGKCSAEAGIRIEF